SADPHSVSSGFGGLPGNATIHRRSGRVYFPEGSRVCRAHARRTDSDPLESVPRDPRAGRTRSASATHEGGGWKRAQRPASDQPAIVSFVETFGYKPDEKCRSSDVGGDGPDRARKQSGKSDLHAHGR